LGTQSFGGKCVNHFEFSRFRSWKPLLYNR